MLEARPDWHRAAPGGVPIPAVLCASCDEAALHLRSHQRVAKVTEAGWAHGTSGR